MSPSSSSSSLPSHPPPHHPSSNNHDGRNSTGVSPSHTPNPRLNAGSISSSSIPTQAGVGQRSNPPSRKTSTDPNYTIPQPPSQFHSNPPSGTSTPNTLPPTNHNLSLGQRPRFPTTGSGTPLHGLSGSGPTSGTSTPNGPLPPTTFAPSPFLHTGHMDPLSAQPAGYMSPVGGAGMNLQHQTGMNGMGAGMAMGMGFGHAHNVHEWANAGNFLRGGYSMPHMGGGNGGTQLGQKTSSTGGSTTDTMKGDNTPMKGVINLDDPSNVNTSGGNAMQQNSRWPEVMGGMKNPNIDGVRSNHGTPVISPRIGQGGQGVDPAVQQQALATAQHALAYAQAQAGGMAMPSNGEQNMGNVGRSQGGMYPVLNSQQGQYSGMDIGSMAMRYSQMAVQNQGHSTPGHIQPTENINPAARQAGGTPLSAMNHNAQLSMLGGAPWATAALPGDTAASTAVMTNAGGLNWADVQSVISQQPNLASGSRMNMDVKPDIGGPEIVRRTSHNTPSLSGSRAQTPANPSHHYGPGEAISMSMPGSPHQHRSNQHHPNLVQSVENALAKLGAPPQPPGSKRTSGTATPVGGASFAPRQSSTSAPNSRATSPHGGDRRRKSHAVFSYSGAISRGPSPVPETAPLPPVTAPSPIQDVNMDPEHTENAAAGPSDAAASTAPVKADYRKRKRNRTIQSCLPCHQNKRKCDRKKPCSRCKALGLTGSCVYEVDHDREDDDPTQDVNNHLRDRIAELEQVVRELRQKGAMRAGGNTIQLPPEQPEPQPKRRKMGDNIGPGEHTSAESSRRTSFSDHHTSSVAMAEADGRRISNTSRVSHSRIPSEEMYSANTSLLPGDELVGDALGRQAYIGVPGGRNMLRRLADLTAVRTGDTPLSAGVPEEPLESAAFTGFFPDQRKTFPFTTIWSHERFSEEVVGILPSVDQSMLLWRSFEDEIARYFSAWHQPTLKAEFDTFFRLSPHDQMETTLGTLSVMLMICALGVMVRASEKEIFGTTSVPSSDVIPGHEDLTCSRMQSELFLSGAYQALRLCSFMSSPTISTITSEIMMVIYLLNSERASDAWPELGIVIRQAVAMGLHIDPLQLYPDISLRDAEVRRRIWWTIAGLDALLCLSLGRPSAITYYNTLLPQDRPDDKLTDEPGYAAQSPSKQTNRSETTSFTYHTAYFALTIPSFDILSRVFSQDRRYGRSGVRGWFAPPSADMPGLDGAGGTTTYYDAIRLDGDIMAWYNLIPAGMRFHADVDNAQSLLSTRPQWQINQALALCVKMNMTRLILHRPYLRADPAAYPHSTEICFDACHTMLAAYRAMVGTKASIAWSWWTMSLRSFHAGTVCAFLAIRQPDTPMAVQCLEDIRGAISIFEGRLRTWLTSHPVQGHLCQGLLSLERLAATATRIARQREYAASQGHEDPKGYQDSDSMQGSDRGTSSSRFLNRSAIQAFPALNQFPPSPATMYDRPSTARSMGGSSLALNVSGRNPNEIDPTPFHHMFPTAQSSAVMENAAGMRGTADAMALPQFWADVFGIPLDEEDQSQGNPLLAL